jgi:hypothetical protein
MDSDILDKNNELQCLLMDIQRLNVRITEIGNTKPSYIYKPTETLLKNR